MPTLAKGYHISVGQNAHRFQAFAIAQINGDVMLSLANLQTKSCRQLGKLAQRLVYRFAKGSARHGRFFH